MVGMVVVVVMVGKNGVVWVGDDSLLGDMGGSGEDEGLAMGGEEGVVWVAMMGGYGWVMIIFS